MNLNSKERLFDGVFHARIIACIFGRIYGCRIVLKSTRCGDPEDGSVNIPLAGNLSNLASGLKPVDFRPVTVEEDRIKI